MTPEAQRIAIAEACHPVFTKGTDGEWYFNSPYEGLVIFDLNDLNAMHEAKKTLNPIKGIELCCHLNDMGISGEWEILNATAAQLVEAFLRTIGKWTTNPNEL